MVKLSRKSVSEWLAGCFGLLLSRTQVLDRAGVAQLVERHLAKVTVESSSLFTRSILFLSIKTQFTFRYNCGQGLSAYQVRYAD